MRVLHIAYQQLRRYGKTRVSWAQKLTHGLIKNDHFVQGFSDRDVAAFEAPFGWRDLGKGKANKRLLETTEAFDPDLVIAGHCDIVSNETLEKIRQIRPGVALAHCNNDPLFVPENVEKIKHRAQVVDAIFVSTGRRELSIFEGSRARVYYMPNPVDPAVESFDNSVKDNLEIDLLFCSNSNDLTKRLELVKSLKDTLSAEMNFKTFGSFGEPPIWGRNYDRALSETKMGLNLNRQEGSYWYSSRLSSKDDSFLRFLGKPFFLRRSSKVKSGRLILIHRPGFPGCTKQSLFPPRANGLIVFSKIMTSCFRPN